MILPRLAAALALFSSIAVTFLLAKKFFRYSFLQIIPLLTITFSSPVIWFTGKIIGPEILGQLICVTGTALSLFAYKQLTIHHDKQDCADKRT